MIDEELTLPHADHAERALLGGMMLSADGYYECAAVTADDFYLDSHRRIYRAMGKLRADGVTIDIVTLSNLLIASKEVDAIGGVAYLASLTEGLPLRASLLDYAAIVKEKSKLRRIYQLAESTRASALDGIEDSTALASRWEESMMRILDDREDDDPLVSSYLVKTLDRIEEESKREPGLIGLSYGLTPLDDFTCGMQAGEVCVVGARSGVGKSSLMIQAAVANCKAGVPVHLFSLEMTREQIVRRILSILSNVFYFRLRDPREMNRLDREAVRDAAETLAGWPLRIHDRSEMDIAQLVSLARLSIRRHGTGFVAVDYAQIAQGPGRDERTRVAGVSRSLTAMIKHERASLMLLSQLRKVDRESYSKPPHIADLRETGQLENDCHVCLLLHRGWDQEAGKLAADGQIIIPKQRNGDTGTIDVTFDRNFVVFGGT